MLAISTVVICITMIAFIIKQIDVLSVRQNILIQLSNKKLITLIHGPVIIILKVSVHKMIDFAMFLFSCTTYTYIPISPYNHIYIYTYININLESKN